MPVVRSGTRGRTWPAVAAAAAVAMALVACSAHVARAGPILARRWGLLAELGAWALLAAVGTVLVFRVRLPRRTVVVGVIGVGVAVRLAALAGPPTTSDDLYRYAWDARVQAAGIDPYAEPPASPVLEPLREGWLWPDASGCDALRRPPGCTRINRPAVRTIYPPLAEAWFGAVGRVASMSGPSGDAGVAHRDKPWQVAGAAVDTATLVLLATTLRRRGRDPRAVAVYALAPPAPLELVGNAHVDGLAILLMVAALAVASAPSSPGAGRGLAPEDHAARAASMGRHVVAGALIGAAALVKLYPLLLLVALIPGRTGPTGPPGRRAGARDGFAACAAASVVVAVGYLPHVARVGWRVLGYLPGYLREEDYGSGGRFLLARVLHVPPSLAAAATVVVAAAFVVAALRRHGGPIGRSCVLLAALLLATTPVQPWYGVALLAIAALAAELRWTAIVAAAYPYFFAVILDHPGRVALGQLSYGLAAAVVLVLSLRRRSARRCAHGAPGPAPASARDGPRPLATIAGTHRGRGKR